MEKRTAIIIPARYASTRLPGKPLALIAGKTMLERVVTVAKAVAVAYPDVFVAVTSDDDRIEAHCKDIGVAYVPTSPECFSGTDRVASAVEQLEVKPDFIINLQGDAPLTPPDFLLRMIDGFYQSPCDVVTPVTRLTWDELDKLRKNKIVTPFSGTCAVFSEETGKAFWFSKNIIPALRNETVLRRESAHSPVYRHIGLYGYSSEMLKKYGSLPKGTFEQLEGLEQLRIIENGYDIRCIPVTYGNYPNMTGIDSPEDITRAESIIAEHGELV